MTQSAAVRGVQLPAPGYPMVTRVVSLPPLAKLPEEVLWIVSQQNPLMPGFRIVRMFDSDSGVEVYSVSDDGASALRHRIPTMMVKLVEEGMPVPVFVKELEDAESEGEDEDEEEIENDAAPGSGLELDDQPPLGGTPPAIA